MLRVVCGTCVGVYSVVDVWGVVDGDRVSVSLEYLLRVRLQMCVMDRCSSCCVKFLGVKRGVVCAVRRQGEVWIRER